MGETRTDSIFLTGLALHAFHGVMPHERKVGQSFKLDILLEIDLGEASRSDRLAHTVSYDQVADATRKAFCAQPYRLIEAAAGAVIDALMKRFPRVKRVRITVHKPHAPIAATFDDVGVTIARTRDA